MFFECKNCGGNVVYDPSKGRMYCPHCDSEESQEMKKDDSLTVCPNCGGTLNVKQYTSACKCEYCGCYLIFDERVEGEFTPHMILPFKVSKAAAVEAMKKEFGTRIFTPADFMSEKSLKGMEGIYVPFWMYDYQAEYDFAGEGTKVRTWVAGNMEYVETSYYEVLRKMDATFDRIPVDASYAMADGVMDLMEPYNYQELIGFEPKYMSGFYGEVYNQTSDELDGRAQVKARNASEEMLQTSLQGYQSMKTQQKDLKLTDSGVNYALMPVWQYEYSYKGQTYQYHVNGQTGKVVGITPVSKPTVLLYGASVFAFVTAICTLVVRILEIL
jgi:DNA-directed RNA polymerase subunit RPC12/RpoP